MEHHISKLTIAIVVAVSLFFQNGCTKTEYVTEAPADADTTLAPGVFFVAVMWAEDTKIQISWSIPDDDDLQSFEVGLNDSVIAYDLDKTLSTYTIPNLKPDTEYQLSVVARDQSLNATVAKTTAKTRLSFVKSIRKLEPGYKDFQFERSIKTSDGGFLIEGRGTNYPDRSPFRDFMIKLNAAYSIEWKKEYGDWSASATYGLPSLCECPDGGYLLTHRLALTKLDALGEIQWTTLFPDEYRIAELSSSVYDASGDIITVGNSDRNRPNGPVGIEYFIMKLSSSGDERWHKYGGQYNTNYPRAVYTLKDNSLLIAGTCREFFWTMRTNEAGDELTSSVFPNNYSTYDSPRSAYLDAHENLILFGGTASPRALKVDRNGKILWDIYSGLADYHSYSFFGPYGTTTTGDLLVIETNDRGISLNVLSPDGNISRIKTFEDYRKIMMLKENPEGYYEMLSSDGHLYTLDKDGFSGTN
ncbi:MAG: fibronectin type III domain-containing protein [Prolixibacteraceae bacterium]